MREVLNGTVAVAAEPASEVGDLASELRRVYTESAEQDVRVLEQQLGLVSDDPSLWATCRQRMCDVSHNVKGQGANFGYPLMTRIGASLSRFLGTSAELDDGVEALLKAHVAALGTVLRNEIHGDGGEPGRALAERLEALVGEAGD